MTGNKRKQGVEKSNPSKRAKKGNDNKWRTPQHLANLDARVEAGHAIEHGDAGFWVTCQRGMERKAISEVMRTCDRLGESMYGIQPPAVDEEDKATATMEEAQESGDIAAAVAAEVEAIKEASKKPKSDHTFLPVRGDLDCVFFVKTRSPVDPIEFVRSICTDALTRDPRERILRHINKLTPVVSMGKSLDKGLEKAARSTLAPYFQLKPESGEEEKETQNGSDGQGEPAACTYAIRPAVRSSKLERSEVIERVASLIGPRHKVNLGSPDKVILVDVFKNFCGFSVVDAPEWERLRKYNINEIHKLADDKRKEGRQGQTQAQDGNGEKSQAESAGGSGDGEAAPAPSSTTA